MYIINDKIITMGWQYVNGVDIEKLDEFLKTLQYLLCSNIGIIWSDALILLLEYNVKSVAVCSDILTQEYRH